MLIAQSIVFAAQIYAAVGVLVAVLFVLFGIDRVDPAARGTYTFRPLLVPGVVVLWPVVLIRWLALEDRAKDGAHHNGSAPGGKS